MAIPGAVRLRLWSWNAAVKMGIGGRAGFLTQAARSPKRLEAGVEQWIDHRRRRQDRLEQEGHDGGEGRVR